MSRWLHRERQITLTFTSQRDLILRIKRPSVQRTARAEKAPILTDNAGAAFPRGCDGADEGTALSGLWVRQQRRTGSSPLYRFSAMQLMFANT